MKLCSFFFLVLKSIAFRSVKRITLLISISWHFIHYKSNEVVGFINSFFSLSFCQCRATRVHTLTKRKSEFAIWHFIKMKTKKKKEFLWFTTWNLVKLNEIILRTHFYSFIHIFRDTSMLHRIDGHYVHASTCKNTNDGTQNFLRYTIRTDVLFIYNFFFLFLSFYLYFSLLVYDIFSLLKSRSWFKKKRQIQNSIELLLSKCKCQQQERKKKISCGWFWMLCMYCIEVQFRLEIPEIIQINVFFFFFFLVVHLFGRNTFQQDGISECIYGDEIHDKNTRK